MAEARRSVHSSPRASRARPPYLPTVSSPSSEASLGEVDRPKAETEGAMAYSGACPVRLKWSTNALIVLIASGYSRTI